MTADAFARALRSLETLEIPAGGCERSLALAGLHLRVRLASPLLAELTLRALAHHAVVGAPSAEPDLTIFVLDRDAPGNPLRDLPRVGSSRGAASSERVERWSYDGPEGQGLLHEGFRALFLWNRALGRAALWLGDAGDLPYHLVAAPLLPILSWFLAERGLSVVHGAAVGTPSGALLLGGRSGTGKSTAALACLNDGLGFLGDDMCIVDPGEPLVVHSLFCSAKLDAPDTARFPALSAALVAAGAGWDKAVYLFDRHRAGEVVRRAPLAGVAIPRRGAIGAAAPLSPREGFLAMAPNTVFQLPGAARAACAGVKQIVSRVPLHVLGVGDDIAEIPARVRDFARMLPSRGGGMKDRA
jgi:hypothetical protein